MTPPSSYLTRSSEAGTNHQAAWLGVLVIVAVFLGLILLVGPRHEFPVQDDWDYSKTTFNLLTTGEFHRGEGTQATVLFPALWGGAFARVFGFSFTTLRASTLVLALGALLFFYALLGELGFDVPRRTVGALALMVTPTFVFLAFSFMTDVPLLFGILGGLCAYSRGWRREDTRFVILGSALASLGFLARQVGALLPVAFALFVFAWGRKRGWSLSKRAKWILAGTALPALTVVAYLLWVRFFGGATWADRARTLGETLAFWFRPNTVGVVTRRYVIAAATIGLYLLPLWWSAFRVTPRIGSAWAAVGRVKRAALIVLGVVFPVALLRLALRGEWFPYLTDILTRRGLRPYLGYFAYYAGAHRPFVFPLAASVGLTALAGVVGLLLSWLAVGWQSSDLTPELSFVYGATVGVGIVSLIFFSYYERYLLPLMPGAIILIIDASRHARFSPRAGAIGVAIVGLFSAALMRDYFAWNQVKWDAGRALLAQGVPARQIDGGLEWDGWYLYDESMAYIRAHNAPITIAPWLYVLDPKYLFAFEIPPGYELMQELPFSTPLRPGGRDHIFLLERDGP